MRIGILLLLGAAVTAGACSPKQSLQNDPWLDADPVVEEVAVVPSDTLTYDFLAEEPPPPPEADAVLAEPDLPVLDEEPPPASLPPPAAAQPGSPAAPAATPPPVETASSAPASPLFYVQVFASTSRPSAEEHALAADAELEQPVRILFMDPFYKVLVGGFAAREEAVALRRTLSEAGYKDAWIFER
jgi:hypothetical protein